MKFLSVLVSALALVWGTEAMAEPRQQTRESAQEFLRITFVQGTTRVLARSYELPSGGLLDWNMAAQTDYPRGRRTYRFEPYIALSAAAVQRCTTDFRFRVPNAVNQGDGLWIFHPPTGVYGPDDNVVQYRVDWSSVASVTVLGSDVQISDRLKFRFPSDALAARAGYAMEFLRLECDPAAQTGF